MRRAIPGPENILHLRRAITCVREDACIRSQSRAQAYSTPYIGAIVSTRGIFSSVVQDCL